MSDVKKTTILILGAGFGGTYAALRLDRTLARRSDCEVILVDKTNFILFTPMLHEVAASDLDPSDIVNPIRKLLRNVTFYEAKVDSIDLHTKQVTIAFGLHRKRQLKFDHLVLALGSESRFFDEQTRINAMQMKTLTDAILLRNRMIGLLESATVEEDADTRRRLMTFVVAGGGFAGVETIGAMNDFLRDAVKSYPKVDPKLLRIILVHAGKVVLPEFTESLGIYTTERLREAGIDVRLNNKVKTYDGQAVQFEGGETIPTATLLWTTGVAPPQILQDLPLKKEKGRIVVNGCMESEIAGVWAVGDAAHIPDPHNQQKPYPATAQNAMRQGTLLAKNLEAVVLGGGRQPTPFTYKMLGQLAAIGQRRGAASILGLHFSGFIAWFLWRTTYLWKLPRLEKKLRVAFGWTIDLFFSRDLVQVITAEEVQRFAALAQRHQLTPPEKPDGTRVPAAQTATLP